jgi:hypothetical protein
VILRLFVFIFGFAAVLLVPGAGIAYIGHKLLKPVLDRRRRLKAAEDRAKYIKAIASEGSQMCSICLGFTDLETDCYEKPHGWFHAACMEQLLKGE